MKRARKIGVWAVALFAVMTGLGLTVASAAAEPTYYICYASNDYKVSATNALKKDGDAYSISPTLGRGDKFFISDGNGRLWGNKKGEPLTVTESGVHRYTVRFDPNAEAGENVRFDFYAPTEYSLTAGGTPTAMTYRRSNAVFEEYYAEVTLAAGDIVTVTGTAGVYGETGLDTPGVTVGLAGTYRFTFTADADHLYADGKYIAYTEVPALYLLIAENEFTQDEAYRLTRDEETVAFAQYRFAIDVPTNAYELTYSVYDADADKTYRPSESGRITVRDRGRYAVLYSPDHAYSIDGGTRYYTGVERIPEFYDGYFVLGDCNDFTFSDSDVFAETYQLLKDETQKDYDEYTLTLYVTDELLRRSDGKTEFYITDGETLYRKPNGDNIVIDRAGEYKLTFSPEHTYGFGYHYRYTRIGDEIERQTVRIDSAEAFTDFLAACTSPEYSLNKAFELTCDVDLTGRIVAPARIFAGTFDGLFRTVRGVTLSGENDYTALFERVTADGAICRTAFDVRIDGDGRYTGLIGENNGHIADLTVCGRVAGNDYVGAVAAVNAGGGTVENCRAATAVEGVLNVGGIVGFNVGRISDCRNVGAVNDKTFSTAEARGMLNVGGVAGYSTGTVEGCENAASVGLGQGRNVGGIVGLSSGGLYMNGNVGAVSGATNAGGIVGYYGRMAQESGAADLTQEIRDFLDKYFGTDNGPNFEESEDSGIHQVYYCRNGGAVTAENAAGGIAGYAGAAGLKIVACLSTGAVTAHTARAGGVVGELGEGTVSDCMTYGDVTARKGSYAGGIAGRAVGRIEHCQTSAYVEAEISDAGGIVGFGAAVFGCFSNAFVGEGTGDRFGLIAGTATLAETERNFYIEGTPRGIGGIEYGEQSNYAACSRTAADCASVGMLSPLLTLDADRFLAGETEPRYPTPRAFDEVVLPDRLSDEVGFTARFDAFRVSVRDAIDTGGRQSVTVTFYAYDFDAETFNRLTSFRLHSGEGLSDDQVPAVPEKDGYFVWWDASDFTAFTRNTEIYQRFDRAVATLSSDDGVRPAVLVEGKFYSDTMLELAYNGDFVTLRFTRGGRPVSYGDVTVRYFVGDTDGCSIRLVRGDGVYDVDSTAAGEYLCFRLPEGCGFTAVRAERSLLWLWILLGISGGALVTAAGFTVGILLNKRKKA